MKYLPLILATLAAVSCGSPQPVETPAQRLHAVLSQGVKDGKILYGHQDDLAYGHTWKVEDWASDPLTRSDVKDVTGLYPAVTATDQATLRKAVRIERRMELAFECLRYEDLIRWRLVEKALNTYNYINLEPTDCLNKVVNKDYWFWGITPSIDEDGIADFSALFDAGLCQTGAKRNFPARQYLLPIPTHDIELSGGNLVNNEGY